MKNAILAAAVSTILFGCGGGGSSSSQGQTAENNNRPAAELNAIILSDSLQGTTTTYENQYNQEDKASFRFYQGSGAGTYTFNMHYWNENTYESNDSVFTAFLDRTDDTYYIDYQTLSVDGEVLSLNYTIPMPLMVDKCGMHVSNSVPVTASNGVVGSYSIDIDAHEHRMDGGEYIENGQHFTLAGERVCEIVRHEVLAMNGTEYPTENTYYVHRDFGLVAFTDTDGNYYQ